MFSDALQSKILDGMEQLALANNELHLKAIAHAEAEHAYRLGRAREFIAASARLGEDGKKLTDAHKTAIVDIATDVQMHRVRLAEAEHEAAGELVKSLRQQLSAGQSLLNAHKAEADAVRYAQTVGA